MKRRDCFLLFFFGLRLPPDCHLRAAELFRTAKFLSPRSTDQFFFFLGLTSLTSAQIEFSPLLLSSRSNRRRRRRRRREIKRLDWIWLAIGRRHDYGAASSLSTRFEIEPPPPPLLAAMRAAAATPIQYGCCRDICHIMARDKRSSPPVCFH